MLILFVLGQTGQTGVTSAASAPKNGQPGPPGQTQHSDSSKANGNGMHFTQRVMKVGATMTPGSHGGFSQETPKEQLRTAAKSVDQLTKVPRV